MKFYVVVNFYLVSLSLKFHEDPFVNARARGGNARIRDITCAHAFLTRAHAFMHGYMRIYLQNNIDFLNTLIFNVFSIFSQFHISKVLHGG